MRWLNRKIFVYFSIFVLIFTFFLFLVWLVPLVFKDKIVGFLKSKINEQITATVDFDEVYISYLKFFPEISVRLDDFCLIKQNDTIFFADKLFLGFNLKKLIFRKTFKVNNLAVENAIFFFTVDNQGAVNWDIFKRSDFQNKSQQTNFLFKKLKFKRTFVNFADYKDSLFFIITDLNLIANGLLSNTSANLNLKSKANLLKLSYKQFQTNAFANLTLTSKVFWNLKNNKNTFSLSNGQIKINDLKFIFYGFVSQINKNFKIDFTIQTENNDFKDLISLFPKSFFDKFYPLDLKGKFSFKSKIFGEFSANKFPNLKFDLQVPYAYLKSKKIPEAVYLSDFKINIFSNSDTIFLKTSDFKLISKSSNIKGNAFAKIFADSLYLSGFYKINANLFLLSKILNIDTSEIKIKGFLDGQTKVYAKSDFSFDKILHNISLDGNFFIKNFYLLLWNTIPFNSDTISVVISKNLVHLKSYNLFLGHSKLAIYGFLDNVVDYILFNDTLFGDFNLRSNLIDLDQIEFFIASIDTLTDTLVIKYPENLNIKLNIVSDNSVYFRKYFGLTKGFLHLMNSKIFMKDITLQTKTGLLTVNGVYDATNYLYPIISLKVFVQNIDIQEIYELFNFSGNLSPILQTAVGKTNFFINFKAQLDYKLDLLFPSFNGNGFIQADSIKIFGNKFFKLLAIAIGDKNLKNPIITDLNLQFSVINGNLIIPPTTISLSRINIQIDGISYSDQNIDFHLVLNIKPNRAKNILKRQFSKIKSKIKVFVDVGGTVFDPKIVSVRTNILPFVMYQNKDTTLLDTAKRTLIQRILDSAYRQADSLMKIAQQKADSIRLEAKKRTEKIFSDAYKKIQKKQRKNKKNLDKAIQRIMNEAVKKANRISQIADRKAKQILNKYRKQANKIIKEAEKRIKKIVKKS